MPPTGSNFTDWQQVEKESRLLIDEDFSWSEPPQRRRRRMTEGAAPMRSGLEEQPIRAGRRVAVLDYEPDYADEPYGSSYAEEAHAAAEQAPAVRDREWDQPTAVHSHFDEMMEQWNASYGASAQREPAERAFDLSDPGEGTSGHGARRTVLITGHGDERYLPAPRRRSSELRFHERSGFSPDRLGLWAVLLSVVLVLVAVAH
ncbi:MAG TPA: hypothetical protein VG228_07045 [Solirubrobacteraceae bacterium]|jgi:hypothetical protein|nr:hypothetical protein [Solirubrobacteraceae bacterium]